MLRRNVFNWIFAAAVLLLFNGAARALRSVVMTGGGAVKAGSRATFRCSYDLEGAPLYSIRWYRNQDEFYRYVPKESPPTKVFSLPGIHVDLSASNDQHVTLSSVHRQLAGFYYCEVSADAPLFHTDIQSTRLDVVDIPNAAPRLVVDRLRYSAGDSVRANCSSPVSYPPANLTWYLNEKMMNNTFTTTWPLNPDLWQASSSFSIIEVETEEQVQHPRYQVGGSQQEISSAQLKIPSSNPEITIYTAYSPIPLNPIEVYKEPGINNDKNYETNTRDYPLRVGTVLINITKFKMLPGFGKILKLKCEATIYDVYKTSSDVIEVKEELPYISPVRGQSSTGCNRVELISVYLSIIFTLFVIWKILLSTR